METMLEVCKKYKIQPVFDNSKNGIAVGLGDLIRCIQAFKMGNLRPPVYVNLLYFVPESQLNYSPDPINQLEFRFKLLNDLLKSNDLPLDSIQFIFSKNTHISVEHIIDQTFIPLQISSPILPTTVTNKPYCIFHTKLRLNRGCNYAAIKFYLAAFCESFQSKYDILLLGEKTFTPNYETSVHGVTTCYNELCNLKKRNTVYDLTRDEIYNQLDYDAYLHDVDIIKKASFNICFGLGGSLCTSLTFAKKTIHVIPPALKFSPLKVIGQEYIVVESVDELQSILN